MKDQEVINLVCFLAWAGNDLRTKSPEQIIDAYYKIAQNPNDAKGSLDLNALNEVIEWTKQWMPDKAPEGGKAEEFTSRMPQGRPDDQPSE